MDEIARVKDKGTQKEVYEKYSAGEITRDEIKEFKPKKLNETFSFSNDVWTCSFFRNIGQDWIINRIKNHENYELRIKEVSTFTNYIQDDKSEISFVLTMTAKIKNAFKDKFDSFITKKSKLLELNTFYKITIKPTGKLFIASFIAPDHKEKEIEQPKINHTLERFENADNDLVEQAKTFTENFPRKKSYSKKRWFMNDAFDALYGEHEKGETIGVSHYSTHAFMEYFNITIPKDFPDTPDTQRYRIIVEEI